MIWNRLRPTPGTAPLPRWPLLALLAVLAAGCTDVEITGPEAPDAEDVNFATELGVNLGQMQERESGLWVQDLEVGEGEPVEGGDQVSVYYTGWLPDATVIDSKQEGEPFVFDVGAGQVIPGWDEGVRGMKPGGVRRLLIPPHLAYGPQGAGAVPPNAWLVFEIELVAIG